MKIYLDVCCINRPFDDQKQTRIRLESEAILMILDRIRTSEYTWVTSDVFQAEIERIPDVEKRERVSLII